MLSPERNVALCSELFLYWIGETVFEENALPTGTLQSFIHLVLSNYDWDTVTHAWAQTQCQTNFLNFMMPSLHPHYRRYERLLCALLCISWKVRNARQNVPCPTMRRETERGKHRLAWWNCDWNVRTQKKTKRREWKALADTYHTWAVDVRKCVCLCVCVSRR